MFIRTKKKADNRISIQIVANIRDGNKIKQKIIRHVGVAHNAKEVEQLKDLATFIKISLEEEKQPNLIPSEQLAEAAIKQRKKHEESESEEELNVNLKALREEARTTIGIHEVMGALYEQLGFNKLFSSRNGSARNYLQNIVMARIGNPSSKRASVKNLQDDFGMRLNLDMVYRMMDKLDSGVIDKIKDLSYVGGQKLLNSKFDVLFYDATTLYFESVEEDELRSKGYSKDMKFNQVQVLLAIMVTSSGIPIGYELFPGNKFEGHTLKEAISRIDAKYAINKIYIVADRGLLSEDNLQYLETSGHKYIVGARLKNMNKITKEELLDLATYEDIGDIKYKDLKLADTNRRIIAHYCPKRARKDQHERNKSVEKLVKKLSNSSDPTKLISNYGYKKYLNIHGKSEVSVDETKIAQDARWDGICGIITNDASIKAQEVLSHYKGLWQIEETFRVSKHDLQIRPIYHWSPRRIEAHIAICYIALVLVRHLEYRVALQYKKLSPAAIIDNLSRVQLSFLRHKTTKQQYCIPSKVSDEANKIYKIITGFTPPGTPFRVT
jgi:transposase